MFEEHDYCYCMLLMSIQSVTFEATTHDLDCLLLATRVAMEGNSYRRN